MRTILEFSNNELYEAKRAINAGNYSNALNDIVAELARIIDGIGCENEECFTAEEYDDFREEWKSVTVKYDYNTVSRVKDLIFEIITENGVSID